MLWVTKWIGESWLSLPYPEKALDSGDDDDDDDDDEEEEEEEEEDYNDSH